ncbi:hypothetical protein KY285_007556 [Solanum tuberosum]|nr:hypothetical protein KY289_007904 [Solanum tuberosum]KAH0745899.1 hypothetical protein KY285_007556 [Solanum tuberosum]
MVGVVDSPVSLTPHTGVEREGISGKVEVMNSKMIGRFDFSSYEFFGRGSGFRHVKEQMKEILKKLREI